MSPLTKFLIAAGGVLAAYLIVTPAKSHEWYPIECCSAMDCAPAEVESISISSSALPVMVVRTKFGTAEVPANFPRRESKDGQLHACMRATQFGTMKLLCLFVPPAS